MPPERFLNRREFLAATGLALGSLALGGCGEEVLLRVGANNWPGYEFMFAGSAEQLFSADEIRMIRMPSATAVLQALAAGQLDAAALTLDEVLTARTDGLNLRVVAVIDVSVGADMVLARPGIRTTEDIRGRRICCEQSAVGAVMLDAFLTAFKLTPADVTLGYATVDQHVAEFSQGKADLVVTFNPVAQEILSLGAERIFDSAAIPGRIVDTLAVIEDTLTRNATALRKVIAAHFEMLGRFRRNPAALAPLLAQGLKVPPARVDACYAGLDLPDAMANRGWMEGAKPRLRQSAEELARVMVNAKLLPAPPDLAQIVVDGFLPGQRS